jgi:mRNA interferase MazF
MGAYIPKQGDLVTLDFDPQSGHEQRGRRPALVISKEAFNKSTGMAICCPITNTDRKVPLHVRVTDRCSLTGFVMCDQAKSLDFQARRMKFIEGATRDLLDDVLAILDAILF